MARSQRPQQLRLCSPGRSHASRKATVIASTCLKTPTDDGEAHDQEQRGHASTIGAEQGKDFTALDLEGDRFESLKASLKWLPSSALWAPSPTRRRAGEGERQAG